jgi:glycosyltransferase involved in cell wall biosynthesis
MDSLVSIIIPVYNGAPHLRQSIDSALAQTWPNKEIIIIDDGSTDDSADIADSYGNLQITVIRQANAGASAARNSGLKHAKGAYIQFLDADDILSIDKIETQVKALRNHPDKVAVCSTAHFNNGRVHTGGLLSAYEDAFLVDTNDPTYFLINLWGGYGENGSMVQPNAWLTPIAVIEKAGPWNEQLTVDDDGEYFCRVVLNSNGVIKTGGLNYYRKYQFDFQNVSAGKAELHFFSLYRSLTLRYQHILAHNSSDELKKAYAKSLFSLKNSIYPSFPALKQEINSAIQKLGIDIVDNYPVKERIKKRARHLKAEALRLFKKVK